MLFYKNKYVHRMQENENDCGIACVSAILNYYGINTNVAKLEEALNTSYYGTDIRTIYDFFNDMKSSPKVYKRNINKDMSSFIMYNKDPILALINNYDKNHYIIIYEIKNGKAIISDPSKPRLIKTDLFKLINKIELLMVISNPKSINKDIVCDKNTSINLFSELLKNNKNDICRVFFYSLFIMIISLGISYYFGIVIDFIIPQNNSNNFLYLLTSIFVIATFISNVTTYIKNMTVIKITKNTEYKINKIFVERILYSKITSDSKVGDTFSRLKDSLSMVDIIGNTLVNTLINFIMCLGSLLVMVYISLELTVIIIIITIILLFITIIFYSRIYDESNKTLLDNAEYSRKFIDSLNSIENIKSLSVENYYYRSIIKSLKDYRYSSNKLNITINNNAVLTQLIYGLANISIIYFGVLNVINESISIGNLIIFNGISSFYFSGIISLMNIQASLERFLVSYQRLKAIFNKTEESNKKDEIELKSKINRVELINYSINKNKENLISNFNYIFDSTINNYIITGESGSGKTTLVKSLIGFEEKYSGEILINNYNIKNIRKDLLRKKIIYISNNEILMNGTILENLCFDRYILKSRLYGVCEDFRVLDYILSLPDGFNHKITQGGKNLSVGQIQRLAIVRAILMNPDVVIFDESFSNIDSENKKIIFQNINKYDFIKIFITHEKMEVSKSKVITINKNIDV